MSKSPKVEQRTYKNVEFRVSKEGEADKISGYGAVFDSPSEDLGYFETLTETIDPKAFDTVMSKNPDVRGLWNHDANHILGRTTSGTLRLKVDARGLAYEIDPPDTQFAKDLMVSMRRKDITASSFAFTVKRDQWTDNPDGSVSRHILEIGDLLDVSPVTYPAYPAASSQVSSIMERCPMEMRSRIKMKRDDPYMDPDGDGMGDCECGCGQCEADACQLCTEKDCDDEACMNRNCPMQKEDDSRKRSQKRRLAHTKEVDGEALHAEDFIYVGDPDKTDTWSLPWHFSDEEKTKSHLRNALARFDQDKVIPEGDRAKAKEKLDKLAKEHGIDVSDDDRAWRQNAETRLRVAIAKAHDQDLSLSSQAV